jgi:hypothetical protein
MIKFIKDIPAISWFMSIIFIILMALFPIVFHDNIWGCQPCADIDYKGRIVPGYKFFSREYCFSCEALTKPEDPLLMKRLVSVKNMLKGCPKEYKDRYNENAKRLNAEMVARGYEPRFEIVGD